MQSNLFPEDASLFNTYWNEFDGGLSGFPPPVPTLSHPPPHLGPLPLQFDNVTYGFLPPPPVVNGMACPIGPALGRLNPNPMGGPIPPRNYHRPYGPPVGLPPTPAMMPAIPSGPQLPPAPMLGQHVFPGFQPPPPQHGLPFPQVLPHVPVDLPQPEKSNFNDMGQTEQVVVKNGQVFHISFIDDPPPEQNPATELPAQATEDLEEDERDWINYDELPLLQNVDGGETKEGKFKCGHCDKELKTSLNLYIHEQTHKTTRLDCKVCGKRFNRIGKLEHHVSKHHPSAAAVTTGGIKTDEATPPVKSSSSTPVLNDFSNYCVECEEFFSTEDDLQSHMELNHRLIDDDPDSKSSLMLKNKSIGCPYCEEMFEWPCMLKTHMTKHTGEKPFICEQCNISFRFVQSFYRHNRRVHGREK